MFYVLSVITHRDCW